MGCRGCGREEEEEERGGVSGRAFFEGNCKGKRHGRACNRPRNLTRKVPRLGP